MSEETKIYCPFTIDDKFGRMSYEIKPSANCIEIRRPIFSNEGDKIKTSFSGNLYYTSGDSSTPYPLGYLYTNGLGNKGNKYNKQYRKEVLWDFGDGTKKVGYNVEHYYKKPGRYCITCTFFDINRKGYKNSFCAYVIVKELIPTQLSFVKSFTSSDGTKTVYTKSNISCSKIERIARMECFVSNTIDKELNVFVKRTDDTTHPSYFDLKDNGNLHETRYWTTLRNEQLLYYRTNQVYSNWLQPSDTFNPNYSKLYYRLTYNSETKERIFEFYQVIPYKDIDDILNYITVLNPNGDIRQRASTKQYKIIQKYTQEQLPSDVVYCGLRGFVDIFYKNDIVNDSSDFSIFYDIETDNITGELKSSANYLNINPLGLTVNTKANSLAKVKLAASGNYFLKEVEGGAKLTDKDKVYIDPYFEGSLYKGVNLTCYVFPFCTYENSSFKMVDGCYYVPKDIKLKIETVENIDKEFESGTNSKVISETNDSNETDMWLKKIELELNNYIDLKIDGTLNDTTKRTIKVVQKPLLNIENISIPKEKQSKVDIDRLLQSYMIHPMFSETSVLKDFVKAYLNTFIQKTTTHSNNFIDNVANSKTCYLSNLIAQLKMMGDDVTEYEYTNFDGINDLKKFTRLLSMNHSDLVGHTREKDWDIYIIKDNKGANVGDVISLDSKITLDAKEASLEEDNDTYGKICKIDIGKDESVTYDDGVDLIVHDKYTNDVKMVNFRTYLKKDGNGEVYLKDYNEDWGWNLLLPENFEILNEKIVFYEQKAKNKAYAQSQIVSFEKEAERLKQRKRDLIDGYYDFYVLIPKKEVERVGHFLEEEDITSKIESVKEWKSDWGITHDILMKILLSNGLMTSERDFEDYQGNLLWETVVINETKSFNRGEISTTIYVEDGDDFEVKGTVTIRGKIFAEGENTLYVTLSDGVIDNKDVFEIENGAPITIVVEGRDINEKTFKIPLKGKRIKEDSNLIIKISENSTIDNPNFQISAEIYYDPAVVSGYINCNYNHEVEGQIFNKEDDELDENFTNQKIIHNSTISIVDGFIEGVGVNSVPLQFTKFSVTQKPYRDKDKITTNELKNIKFDLSDPRLTFNVDDDGNIIHEGETFTFNGNFTKYLTIKEGTITVQLTGTVKEPLLEIVSCEIKYYYDYPQLLSSYNLSDFSSKVSLTNGNEETLTFDERLGELITNAILNVHPVEIQFCIETEDNYIILLDEDNAIDVKQLSEFVTEPTNLKTFINDFSLSLTRNEGETTIVGEDKNYTCVISGKYNIESYDEWILEPIELLVSGEVTISKFGDIIGELKLAIISDKIIKSSIEFTFKVSGDICRGNATLEIVTNTEPRCLYVKTFYLDETFYTKGWKELIIGEAVRIKGFQDVDKVNVRFTEALKDVITTYTASSDSAEEEINGKYLIMEAYNENITPEHEQIDGETGEVVLIPETISKETIYKQVFEVDNSSVNVNENGEITWNEIEFIPGYTTDYERVLIDSNTSKLSINSNNFGIKEFVLEGKIKDYTIFDGSISLSSTEDKANVESIQRTFNGYCDVNVSGQGVLWDDRDTDVNLTLEYRPKIEVTNNKTDKTSNVYISPHQVTKTVTVDKDGLIKIDGGLPTVEIDFEHFDEDEVPSDEYDEEGNLIPNEDEVPSDEYDEEGNLIPKPEAIDDGDFNYKLSGSLSMSGNVQNVRFKELLENLFTISVVDTSFSLSSSQNWNNTEYPKVSGGYKVNVNGKIKKNIEDSYADITITNIDSKIGEHYISEIDRQYHEKFDKNYTIKNKYMFNVHQTQNNIDYVFEGNITVTIKDEDDEDADNYGPDLSVTNTITKAEIIDRNFEINKTCDWSDFTIDGVDENTNLDGGFNVKVENGVMGYENIFDITINKTTINGQELSGETSYSCEINVDYKGNIIDSKTIPFNLTSTDGTTLSGEILISGNVKDLDTLVVTIQNCKIINPLYISKDFEWKDYISNLNISGGFKVDAYYTPSSDTIQFTMYCEETMIDDKILNGFTALPLAMSDVDENGNITPQYDVEFELFDSDGNCFSGKINVIGTLTDIDVEIFDVVYKKIYINCDVSEANGYCPDAYKNGSDSWNTVVLTPNKDVLKISIVNEKGEMLNDE